MPGAERLEVSILEKCWRGAPHGQPALHDIAFVACPGERIALFAPSGTGKTTALRIVLGLDHDFTGQVKRPQGPVGTMFQEPRLLPWMTVAYNIRLVTGDALPQAGIE